MTRATETDQTLRVLKAELALCNQISQFAKSCLELDEFSPKWRRRIKHFCGDTFLRLLRDLEEDILILQEEQEVFGDEI